MIKLPSSAESPTCLINRQAELFKTVCLSTCLGRAIPPALKDLHSPPMLEGILQIWSPQDGYFDSGSHRVKHINQGLHETRKRTTHSELAQRLVRLFYAHEIDELVLTPQESQRPLRKGQGRLTIAFEIMAELLDPTVDIMGRNRCGKKHKHFIGRVAQDRFFGQAKKMACCKSK
jgi:hypothetical protein